MPSRPAASLSSHRALLVVVLLTLGAMLGGPAAAIAQTSAPAPASSETTSAPSNSSSEPSGDSPCDHLTPINRLGCRTVGSVIGSGAERVIAGSANSVLDSVVKWVVDGAGWLLGEVSGFVDNSTTPTVTAGWFTRAYRAMASVALVGLLPFLLLAIISALVRQDAGGLLRATFVYVPVAALGTGAAVVLVDMLVTVTDNLSAWIGAAIGTDLSGFATGLGNAVVHLSGGPGSPVAGLAALLAGGLIAFAVFVIWLELLLRQAGIYVAVLFLPLGFMALVWPATAHWFKGLAQGLVALVLSKFVIVSVIALAATALASSGVAAAGGGAAGAAAAAGSSGGGASVGSFATVLAGGSLLSLAALAPYVLLRLIPVFEAGLSSSLEGTFRRPTAAVGTPANMRGGQIGSMLRRKVGTSGGPGAAGSGESAAGGASGGGMAAGGVAAAGLVGAKATSAAAGQATQTAAAASPEPPSGNGASAHPSPAPGSGAGTGTAGLAPPTPNGRGDMPSDEERS